MKKLIGIIILFLLTSCSSIGGKEYVTYQDCNKVVDKQTPIENNFSVVDYIIGNGSVTKSQTNYYLIFEGGLDTKVNRIDFNTYQIGDEYCITRGSFK